VDTEGFVLKAQVHSAKVMDYEGIKTLLQKANEHFPRLRHLWLEAGYRGEDKGKDWLRGVAEEVGGGADDRLDRLKQEDEQGRREVVCEWRSVRICCHDPPHGEANRPRLRTFHTVSEGKFSEVA
jgi:hypothetical protein